MTRTSADNQAQFPSMNVLVIDDMQSLVTILERGLSRYGQTVYSALSGDEGLELYKQNPIDVVVCDLGMEGMNGLEVSQSIIDLCEQRGVPKTPFILLTGWGEDDEDDDSLHGPGVDKVVTKPVDLEELLTVMTETAHV